MLEVQESVEEECSLISYLLFQLNYLTLNLDWGDNFTPCWFSINNSETVKATKFRIPIRAKFGILNLPQSPGIGQNSDGDISDIRISGQSLLRENYHNSRTSDDIDMKLGPVTKLDKRNKTTSKNF